MTFTPEQTTLLQAKLDPSHVAERTQAGRKLSYIEGWWAIAEANRIFGFDGWHRETVDLQETHRSLTTVPGYGGKPDYEQWRVSFIARVRITVGSIVREGTGYGSGMAKPEALGDAIESAVKEAETDAMKRAFMTFGNPFGLALYDKTQANVGVSADNDRPVTPNTVTGPADPQFADRRTPHVRDWIEGEQKREAAKSSASLKRDGEWEKVMADLANDFVDCHSLASLHKLRVIYRQKAIESGWNKPFLEALKNEFDQQEDALKKVEVLQAGE